MKTQEESTAVDQRRKKIELLVAGRTVHAKTAGAIAKYLAEGYTVSVRAMGAGAVNQAVKALCIARGMVAPKGNNLSFIPAFSDGETDGEQRTSIVFQVIEN